MHEGINKAVPMVLYNHAPADLSKVPRVSVNDLPADVLILIFKEVRRMSCKRYHVPIGASLEAEPVEDNYDNNATTTPWVRTGTATEAPESSPLHGIDTGSRAPQYEDLSLGWLAGEDLFSPTLFPEALASACSLWRETMHGVSAFWTRLVIAVDQDPTPSSKIRSYLAFSADRPIDVHILRHVDRMDSLDSSEGHRVTAVMQLLYPHMARCNTFRMSVRHAASLTIPCISTYDNTHQPNDFRLQPDCVSTSEVATGAVHSCRFTPCSTRMPAQTMQCALTRLSFSASDSSKALFSVRELVAFVNHLPLLLLLELINLELDCDPNGPPLAPPLSLIETVRFTAVRAPVWSAFCRYRFGCVSRVVEFKRCSTLGAYSVPFSLPYTSHVVLTELGTVEDLFAILRNSGGDKLTINSCAGFNVHLLTRMALEVNGSRWLWPNLRCLDIFDCPHLRIDVLRSMVQARREAHKSVHITGNENNRSAVASVGFLSVAGCGKLSEDDKHSFDSCVGSFYWTS